MKKHVWLVDPQPIRALGATGILEGAGYEVGVFKGVEEVFDALNRTQQVIEVLIIFSVNYRYLEGEMGLASSFSQGRARVVLVSSKLPEIMKMRWQVSGVTVFLEETCSGQDLVSVLTSSPAIIQTPALKRLSAREKEVMKLIAQGCKNHEIAETLGISVGTVKIHLMHVMEKVGGERSRFYLALLWNTNRSQAEGGTSVN